MFETELKNEYSWEEVHNGVTYPIRAKVYFRYSIIKKVLTNKKHGKYRLSIFARDQLIEGAFPDQDYEPSLKGLKIAVQKNLIMWQHLGQI
jgi:homoserine trans-succinylase